MGPFPGQISDKMLQKKEIKSFKVCMGRNPAFSLGDAKVAQYLGIQGLWEGPHLQFCPCLHILM